MTAAQRRLIVRTMRLLAALAASTAVATTFLAIVVARDTIGNEVTVANATIYYALAFMYFSGLPILATATLLLIAAFVKAGA
jgi:hypothetical protein